MQNNQQKGKNKMGIFLSIIVVLVIGYMLLNNDPVDTTSALAIDAVPSQVGADLLPVLHELQSLRLDTSIFENSAFRSLSDFTVDIGTQPVGRDNPFAPLPRSGNSTSTVSVPPIRL